MNEHIGNIFPTKNTAMLRGDIRTERFSTTLAPRPFFRFSCANRSERPRFASPKQTKMAQAIDYIPILPFGTFPAPLAPMIPTTPPRGRLKFTPSYRRRFPFALPRFCAGDNQHMTPEQQQSRGTEEGRLWCQKQSHSKDERLHRMKPSAVTQRQQGELWY